MDADDAKNVFRTKVLAALDDATTLIFSRHVTHLSGYTSGGGWRDQDLPALFKVIDKQFEILVSRHALKKPLTVPTQTNANR